MNNNNIDALINEISFEIVKEKIVDKNQIDKMLGVLANDGVYAWWVYTLKELKIGNLNLIEKLWNILEQLFNFKYKEEIKTFKQRIDKGENKEFKQWQDLMSKNFKELSQNLQNLLFFREILEKILIYARYHAKAMGE